MADEDEAQGGAVGDTHEVHDTIHPGDLPLGHPSRPLAEEKLAESEDEEGVAGGEEGDAGG
ncbi:MAG: hypothetical protein ACR2KV_04235 [Solirubrobacteraceae bacterium]